MIDKQIEEAVRDTAIEQMCTTLRQLGIKESDIAKAKAEAIRTNSDKPLMRLAIPMFRAAGFPC